MRMKWVQRLAVGALALAAASVGMSASAQSSASKCNASNPIKVGALYGQSGAFAQVGRLYQQGASMAVRDINASGGLLGRCVKEVLVDSGGNPTQAAQGIRQLVDQEHVAWVEGPFTSAEAGTALPVTSQAKIIEAVGAASATLGDASKYPYALQMEVTTDQIVAGFVPFLKSRHYTKVAAITDNNGFGQLFLAALKSQFPAAGITLTAGIVVNGVTPDMTSQMQQARDSGAQVVLAGSTGDVNQVSLVKARNDIGWKAPVLGTSTMANASTTNNFSDTQMANVFAAANYKTLTYKSKKKGQMAPTWPAAKKFVAEFARWIHAHNIKVSIVSPSGAYDQWMIVANAVKKTKSLDGDTLRAYIESHPYTGVRGVWKFTHDNHSGVQQSGLVFAIAKSLSVYGTTQLAPGQ